MRAPRPRTEWTTIRGPAGHGSLRLRAHVSDHLPDHVANRSPGPLPPMVLVHGWGIGGSYLLPLAARLAPHAPVSVPELPGHGRSDHAARPLTLQELTGALVAWMEARGLRSALLVGHSFGCQIVTEVAVRRPELAAGLVLIAPASDPAARTPARQIVRALRTAPFERPSCALPAALDYRRAGLRVLIEELRQLIAYRLEDALPRVAVPVRVVRGAQDRLVPQPWRRPSPARRAPPPTVIPRWGHAVNYDAPGAVADVVIQLAQTVTPREKTLAPATA